MKEFNLQYPNWIRGQFHKLLFWVLIALLASGVGASAEDKARAAFDAGVKAFASSNYAAASQSFEEAAAAAPIEKLDPDIAKHNARLALTKAEDFEKASKFANPQKLAKEFYNAGNIEFNLAGGPSHDQRTSPVGIATNDINKQSEHIGKAIERYERAIELDSTHINAKANYELALQRQQELQKQQQQQQDQQNQDEKKEEQKDPSQNQQDQQQNQDPQNQEQKKQEQQKEQQKQEQQAKDQDSKKEQAKEAQPEKPSEEMTPEEAAMMLDAMKAQEQSQRDQLHPFFGRPVPVEKDW